MALSLQSTLDKEKWKEFISGSGIEEVRLYQYYLGKIPQSLTAEEYETILTGLLADLVEVGALTLPGTTSVDDFGFAVEVSAGHRRRNDRIKVYRKDKSGRHAGLPVNPHYSLNRHVKREHATYNRMLEKISSNIRL